MRAEKQLIVEDLKKQVGASPFVILTEYKGMTVSQFAELRKRLHKARAEYHVAKNAMLRHAFQAAELPDFDRSLGGMTAVVVGNDKSDIGAVAKVLKQFGKEFEKPKFKAGSLGKKSLTADEISAVADLPSLDGLRGRLIALLQTPATRIAVVLGAPAGQIARVLKAHADKAGAAPATAGAPA
jgi:large subunit ribosomal protein L10